MAAALLAHLWLVPVGFAVGVLGTLIGAGGGFVLMPVLLLLNPGVPPGELAAISLAVVSLNALSGSVAYARARRVDFRSAALFAAATVPGAVLGALTTASIPRRAFDAVFGTLLVAAAAFLAFRPGASRRERPRPGPGVVTRELSSRDGATVTYSFRPLVGVLLSLVVGYLSSLLGIGGGIIHVPLLALLLGFPVHIATATSHAVLVVTALAGTATNAAAGTLRSGWVEVITLGVGVVGGAQLGAWLSARLRGVWILRSLAGALALVGVRILVAGVAGL